MAALPTDHEIVTRIYDWHKSDPSDWRRPHLGGSMIGEECSRKLWYSFRWTLPPDFPGRILRLFETGQLEEKRFVAELRGIGMTVWEVDPETGYQFTISMCGGHAGGSLDGVGINVPGSSRPHLIEMKTHNAKSFADLKRHGVEKSKPVHYAQMQIYGYKMELERALYLAKNKDTDELYAERLHIKKTEGKKLEAKAERIVFSDEPLEGVSNDPAFYQCKFCQFHSVCHGNKAPEVNCRTCAFSTPRPDGTWFCERHKWGLDKYAQREGCLDHLFNPSMLNLEVAEYDPEQHRMAYKSGLVNGQGGLSSWDISNANDIRALDAGAVSIASHFDGRIADGD